MSVRIDTWVWSVRIYKTRSLATQACRAGHVKLNGSAIKPAATVVPGDTVRAWANHRERILEVVDTPHKRVGAPAAATCYIDHSPPPPPKEVFASLPRRDPGAGRPTKKERRQLEQLRGETKR